MALLSGGVTSTVVTDHTPVKYLQTQHVLSKRQGRLSEYLQMYDLKWLYSPGCRNDADPLNQLLVLGACWVHVSFLCCLH